MLKQPDYCHSFELIIYTALPYITQVMKYFPENTNISKVRLIAGSIALVLIIEYLVAETVAALAWKTPLYSYAYNYISDLGVSGPRGLFQGRLLYSPLHNVMNAGFFIEGILFLMAAFLLLPLLPGKGWRIVVFVLVVLHTVGISLVAMIHASSETKDHGILIYHTIGAFLAIMFGNLACMCAGIAASRAGAPGWFKLYSILLCIIGVGGLVTLIAVPTLPPGIPERISVYTITLWQVSTGVFLLIATLKKSPSKR